MLCSLQRRDEMENLEITKHAAERYAERILGKDSQSSVAEYTLTHEEKIQADITKMIAFGKLLYSGKRLFQNADKTIQDIYLNGTWVLVVDHQKNAVVTLYSVDLGLGKEFNDLYLEKMLAKLEKTKEDAEMVAKDVEKQREELKQLMTENQATIIEYRKIVKSLEEQNKMYEELIESLRVQEELAQREVTKVVAALTGKKVY